MNQAMLAVVGLVVGAVLTGCGTEEGPGRASDPAGSSSAPAGKGVRTSIPAAPGQVRTPFPATVMDTGDDVELCLGSVAESYPPQCSGPLITNWSWDDAQGMFDTVDQVRWGTYAVTGTWDGTSFTLDSSIPGPLYDPAPWDPPAYPDPSRDLSEAELQAIADELIDVVPGAQSAGAEGGRVLLDVIYDDGSLQAWADETYGVGVVAINRALVDVE